VRSSRICNDDDELNGALFPTETQKVVVGVIPDTERGFAHEMRAANEEVADGARRPAPAVAMGSAYAAKNASVRTSMLRRGGASSAVVGSRNEVCGVNRARPSAAES